MTLNTWYWLGGAVGFAYGFTHLLNPDLIASSWGKAAWSEETKDFARLLGVWILFQSFIAWVVAGIVKDRKSRYWITIAHVFKNFFAFLMRCSMWNSGRYPITTGFKISAYGDLIFALGYGLYVLFPESDSTIVKKEL